MSAIDRILGRPGRITEVTMSGDVPPMMAAPSSRFSRRSKLSQEEDKKKRRASMVSGVIGMQSESEEKDYVKSGSDDEGVIPQNAEEIEPGEHDASGLHLKAPKFKKDDPDEPTGEEEKLMSPRSALVAPDVTPDSMTEIDPSEVPGKRSTSFKALDLFKEPEPPLAAGPVGGSDQFTSTMDTLLGHNRSSGYPGGAGGRTPPSPAPASMGESRQPISAEAASAMFEDGIGEGSGGDPLKQGVPMPDHTPGDGKKICEAFRKFC